MVTFYQVKSAVGIDPGASSEDDVDAELPRRDWSANTRIAVTAVIGLALVGLALTAGGVVIRSLGTTQTIPETTPAEVVEGENTPGVDEQDTVLTPDLPRIFIHVVGEVHAPGVVDLEGGSRVYDAIEAAGGLTADAAPESLNLARVLGDGEQVVVPGLGDVVQPMAGGVAGAETRLISLSTADEATLDSLPGIGPALAARIVAWRETNGPFSQVSDVLAVSGIGPSTLERFSHLVAP